jgi:aminotransferase
MRDFLSQKVKEIKPSGIRKFFDIASEIKGAISLGVGEPDFDTPWHIREEGIYSLERGKTHYTSNSGLKELRQENDRYQTRQFDTIYDPLKEILLTVGGSEAIDIAFRAMIEPGDEVIVTTPCYVSYEPCVTLAGGNVKITNLNNENEVRLTKKELLEAITPKSKILIMNFPNNPTGAIMEKKDLEAIAKVAIEHDIFVISDEIYSELSYFGEHVSIASLPGMKERTLVINGFSKAFAMTGWRLGYACGPEAIIKQMTKIHQFTIMCAPTQSQYAAVEAIKNGDDDVNQMRESYDERRRYVLHRLKEMGLPCFEPKGAFYLFPDIRQFNMTSEEFSLKLLNEKRVVVVPGNAFGESGNGFIRISYAYSIENLKVALNRISEFLDDLRNKK